MPSDAIGKSTTGHENGLLSLESISKTFPGVVALKDVSFHLRRGEIHGLVGENGAGKSTLIKILAGIYTPERGQILVDGIHQTVSSPRDSARLGLAFIHQDPSLFPELSVAENLFAGSTVPSRLGLIDRMSMRSQARALLAKLEIDIASDTLVRELRSAEGQLVEILRAVSRNSRILVMDEPTSSLAQDDKRRLFKLVAVLRAQGVSLIYVSHFLDEVLELCDRVTVLRDGQRVGTFETASLNKAKLIELMVGRKQQPIPQQRQATAGEPVLSVDRLRGQRVLEDASFEIHRGEIVGVCGLLGAGKTELARALFGLDPVVAGSVKLRGRFVRIRNPRDAMRLGMGLVTESRLREGVFPLMSVMDNATATLFDRLRGAFGLIRRREQVTMAGKIVQSLGIKTAGLTQPIMYLSGGNQQKTLLGRWMLRNPAVLILDEPMHGIDIGAKADFFKILSDLALTGTAVLFISGEVDEVYDVSDRVLVMSGGRITGEFLPADITREHLLAAVTARGFATAAAS